SADVIGFVPFAYARHLEVRKGREPDWGQIERKIDERRSLVEELSNRATAFARSSGCRTNAILRYFGIESGSIPCGRCDHCKPGLPRPWEQVDLTFEDLAEGLPGRQACLSLI